MARDLTVALPHDRASVIAEVGEALGAAAINIEALSATAEGGVLHGLVEDAAPHDAPWKTPASRSSTNAP